MRPTTSEHGWPDAGAPVDVEPAPVILLTPARFADDQAAQLADALGLTPAQRRQARALLRDGATELVAQTRTATLDADKARRAREREARRRRREADDHLSHALTALRSLAAYGADEPDVVGHGFASVIAEAEAGRDDLARAMRAACQYSWAQISDALAVHQRTAIRRWGHYPGGLPEGGGHR